jgi:hypothetical protein
MNEGPLWCPPDPIDCPQCRRIAGICRRSIWRPSTLPPEPPWRRRREAGVDRLVGAILIEAHDEWQASERRYLSEASMATLTPTRHAELTHDRPAIQAAQSRPAEPITRPLLHHPTGLHQHVAARAGVPTHCERERERERERFQTVLPNDG